MLTVPLLATYSLSDNVRLKLGPYASYVRSHKFTGYAYDGYLRVGNPTGTKVELGSEEGSRGTYDFSDSMRNIQAGVVIGADWFFYKQWGAFADLSWGLTGVFHGSFNTIEQTLYPIYGTIGISYKIKQRLKERKEDEEDFYAYRRTDSGIIIIGSRLSGPDEDITQRRRADRTGCYGIGRAL